MQLEHEVPIKNVSEIFPDIFYKSSIFDKFYQLPKTGHYFFFSHETFNFLW